MSFFCMIFLSKAHLNIVRQPHTINSSTNYIPKHTIQASYVTFDI